MPFLIPADRLNPGLNHFRVDIDTLSAYDTWAVTVDWAELKFTQDIGQTQVWAYDDVTIRRGVTDAYIGKTSDLTADLPIWSNFDPTFNIGFDDSIADSSYSNFGEPGPLPPRQFSYRYVFGPGQINTGFPTVNYEWQITTPGGSVALESDSGTLSGWDNRFPVVVPHAIGKYSLHVTLKAFIVGNSAPINTEQRTHTLYVVFDQPQGAGQFVPLI